MIIGSLRDRHYFYTIKDKLKYPNEIRILDKLDFLRRVIICRDAYWKIAGNWEPDWRYDDAKYALYFNKNDVCLEMCAHTQHILAFPSEEMRDSFYENFKELIEKCKELL